MANRISKSVAVVSILLLLLSTFALGDAWAGQDPAFRKHKSLAQSLVKQRRYEDAILEFQAAYEISPVPELLYSIGQAHFVLEQYDKAVESYERFLKERPKPPRKL